jgi:hypothetical protein
VRGFVLNAHVKRVYRPGPRRAPEEDDRRLVEVGQRGACHPREHRRARVRRCDRRHGAHDGEAGQPVGHRHLHEPEAFVPFAPVRRRVEREMRQHAESEGGRGAASRSGADHGTRKHVIGHQHVH